MTKFSILTAGMLMATSAFSISAAQMEKATTVVSGISGAIMDGGINTSASYMVLTWGEGNPVHFVDGATPTFTLTEPGKDPAESKSIALGKPLNATQQPSDYVTLTLSKYAGLSAVQYTVELPGGIIEDAQGNPNQAQTFTFTLVPYSDTIGAKAFTYTPPQSETSYDASYNPLPAPFYSPAELSNVSISLEGGNLQLANQGGDVTAYITYGQNTIMNDKVTADNGQIYIDLSSLEKGNWAINIPQAFIKAEKGGKMQINQSLTMYYVVTGDLMPLNGEVTYPTADVLTSMSYLVVDFGVPVRMEANAPAVTCTKGSQSYPATAKVVMDSQKNYTLRIDLAQEIKEPGTYTITIPEGVVTNGQYKNSPMTFNYTVMPYMENYQVSPENTEISVAEAAQIAITFPDATTIEPLTDNWQNPTAVIKEYGKDNIEETLTLNKNILIEGNKVKIVLDDIKQLNYEITIPANILSISGGYTNPKIVLNYSVWDGMEEALILHAPVNEGLAPDNTEILLTWGYQTISSTDSFAASVIPTSTNAKSFAVDAEDMEIITVKDPEGSETENNALYLNLTNALKEFLATSPSSKTVNLVIPSGIVTNSDGQINPLTILKFSAYLEVPEEFNCVEDKDKPGFYNISWGNYVNWMSVSSGFTLTLTASDGSVTVINKTSSSTPDPGSFNSTSVTNEMGNSTNVITMNLSEMPADVYRLYVPSGIARMNINGAYSPDYVNKYSYTTLIIGDGGISDQQMDEGTHQVVDNILSVNWDNFAKIAFTDPAYQIEFTQPIGYCNVIVSAADGAPVEIPAVINSNGTNYWLEADLTEALENLDDANYTVEIPEGVVMNMSGLVNPKQVIEEKHSSIGDLEESHNSIIRVYNLQGVNVLNCKTPQELRNLPAGIYIIDGKKTVVR